jgi:hypothetical protein
VDPYEYRRFVLTLMVVAAFIAGTIEWIVYWGASSQALCFLQDAHGGQYAGGGWAALLGLLILGTAAVAGLCWRQPFLLLLVGFPSAYAATLGVLWVVSPTIWGPERCTFTPLM